MLPEFTKKRSTKESMDDYLPRIEALTQHTLATLYSHLTSTTDGYPLTLPSLRCIAQYLVGQCEYPYPGLRFLTPSPPLSYLAALRGDPVLDNYMISEQASEVRMYMSCEFIEDDVIQSGVTPTHLAGFAANLSALQAAPVSELSKLTSFGYHTLHCVCMGPRNDPNRLEAVKYVLQTCPKEVLRCSDKHVSVLFTAVEAGNLPVVKLLSELEPNLITLNTTRNCSPLYAAAFNGHAQVAEYLCEKFGDQLLDVVNINNCSAMYVAAQRGHAGIVKYLARLRPAMATLANNNNATPLYIACQMGQLDVATCLCEATTASSSCVGVITTQGMSPLATAAANGHLNVVTFLVKVMNVDPNDRTLSWHSPRELAKENGHADVVSFLDA